jgi:hypothetical protein
LAALVKEATEKNWAVEQWKRGILNILHGGATVNEDEVNSKIPHINDSIDLRYVAAKVEVGVSVAQILNFSPLQQVQRRETSTCSSKSDSKASTTVEECSKCQVREDQWSFD